MEETWLVSDKVPRRESWHTHVKVIQGELIYKGINYEDMGGVSSWKAFSTPGAKGKEGNQSQNPVGESWAQQAALTGTVTLCPGTQAAQGYLPGREPHSCSLSWNFSNAPHSLT